MKRGWLRTLGCAGLALAGSATAVVAEGIAGRCEVRFVAVSTLHDVEGRGACERFEIESEPGGTYRARVSVAVARLDTGLGARDARMREMFDAERYPQIEARFEAIDLGALRSGAPREASGETLTFTLRVRDREVRVVPSLSDFREAPDRSARFSARFALSLAELGLEAPSVLGVVRVEDRVEIEVDAALSGLPELAR
jgi:polyisoprenoid-binding protein YceI